MTTLPSYFGYVDAPAALSWLEKAFGFEATSRWKNSRGVLAHAELRLGDAAIIVFADDGVGYERMRPKSNDAVGHGMYLVVPASTVDEVFERAVAEGGVPVWKPHTSEWGNYRCRDPGGYEWTFGTYKPGEPTGDW